MTHCPSPNRDGWACVADAHGPVAALHVVVAPHPSPMGKTSPPITHDATDCNRPHLSGSVGPRYGVPRSQRNGQRRTANAIGTRIAPQGTGGCIANPRETRPEPQDRWGWCARTPRPPPPPPCTSPCAQLNVLVGALLCFAPIGPRVNHRVPRQASSYHKTNKSQGVGCNPPPPQLHSWILQICMKERRCPT